MFIFFVAEGVICCDICQNYFPANVCNHFDASNSLKAHIEAEKQQRFESYLFLLNEVFLAEKYKERELVGLSTFAVASLQSHRELDSVVFLNCL